MPNILTPELKYITTSQRKRSVGLRFPMSDTSEGGVMSKSFDKELILQNVRQLILTLPGERVMYPQYGIGLTRFLFEPLDSSLMQEIEELIRSQFDRFEPRVVVKQLDFGGNPDQQTRSSENSSVFIKLLLGFTSEFFDDQQMEVLVR